MTFTKYLWKTFQAGRVGHSHDLSGKWSGSFRAQGCRPPIVPQFFILKQDGLKLTSGGPNDGEQYPIENVSSRQLEGDLECAAKTAHLASRHIQCPITGIM
jgi:hypothetical protein